MKIITEDDLIEEIFKKLKSVKIVVSMAGRI